MMKIEYTKEFKQKYQLVKKRGYDLSLLKDVVEMLADSPVLPSSYKDHSLIGQYKGCRECHIKPNWLLVYIRTENELVLVTTGTHADLFKK